LDSEEDFDLSLVYPDGEVWIIPQGHESVTFYPATDDKNQARIEFNPLLDQEGEYKFFANARDASGNVSGEFAYEINFQVILAQKVSNVINYPNPFSSSTQFVFTVTGQVPQSMYIQVMTLSGKVVKEITQDQLGPIKVGINRTSYKWNGTDEYGNQLANGVYLYRAVINDGDNQAIELHETGIDSYFKEGFGKLVILR